MNSNASVQGCNASDPCDIALYLRTNRLLQSMLICRSILAVLGIIFFIIIFKVQGTYLSFHPNARILLLCHQSLTILQSFGTILSNMFNIIRYAIPHEDPRQYLVSTPLSVLIRTPTAITFYGQVWGLFTIAVERAVATYGVHKYEANKSILLAVVLISIQV